MNVHFDSAKHEYRDDAGTLYPSVTTILHAAGKVSFGLMSEEKREAVLRLGTQVHLLLENEDLGCLNPRTVPLKLRPFRKEYLKWKRHTGFQPILIEHRFISRYGYAGTMDRGGRIGGQLCILDLKSGSAIPEYAKLQTVAYGMEWPGYPCRRIVLRVNRDGCRVKEYPMADWNRDFAEFMQCMRKTNGHNRA